MRIGVVSDTHGESWTTGKAVRVLEQFAVDMVIHCGDIGPPEIIPLFADWPGHFVLGNMDNHAEVRQAIVTAGQTCYERFGHLKVAGRSIAFLHGDDTILLRHTIESGQWDLVLHGHTHRATTSRKGRTLVVNPGAIQRTGAPSVAVIEMSSLEVTRIPL